MNRHFFEKYGINYNAFYDHIRKVKKVSLRKISKEEYNQILDEFIEKQTGKKIKTENTHLAGTNRENCIEYSVKFKKRGVNNEMLILSPNERQAILYCMSHNNISESAIKTIEKV